jgi:hypothetical protein
LKERQVFKVVKRTQRSDVIGVKVDDREMRFGQGNMFEITDAGLAKEIHDTQGQGGDGDVIVIPSQIPPTPGVRRTWTGIALPWHDETHKFGGEK